jgi:hypothetical protein
MLRTRRGPPGPARERANPPNSPTHWPPPVVEQFLMEYRSKTQDASIEVCAVCTA